jgi:hypothetical protein
MVYGKKLFNISAHGASAHALYPERLSHVYHRAKGIYLIHDPNVEEKKDNYIICPIPYLSMGSLRDPKSLYLTGIRVKYRSYENGFITSVSIIENGNQIVGKRVLDINSTYNSPSGYKIFEFFANDSNTDTFDSEKMQRSLCVSVGVSFGYGGNTKFLLEEVRAEFYCSSKYW